MRQSLRRRPFGLLLLPLALLVCSLSSSDDASADGSRHPYFNDRGTLRWFHSLASAKATAQREGKLIFIEYGRKRCSNCKKLAERVLPSAQIRGRISSVAIGLAAECDTPEREVYTLFRQHLPGARSLPFVAFVTPRGRWITGWAGYAGPSTVSSHLASAECRLNQILAKRRAASLRSGAGATQPEPATTRPARRPAAQPTPMPTPMPAETPRSPQPDEMPSDPAADEDDCDLEQEDPCADGSCDYNPCAPSCNPFANLFKKRCKPCPPKAAPVVQPTCPPPSPSTGSPAPRQPVIAHGSPDGASAGIERPAARIEAPKRVLATGSPDAGTPSTGSFPPPAKHPALPRPTVKTAARPAEAAPPRVAPKAAADLSDPGVIAAAIGAADRGAWGRVIELTRAATKAEHPALYELNRQAHAWAHKQLAGAVRSIRSRRYAEARAAVDSVRTSMRGEAEAVDAERGAEAIELMRDIEPLAEKSLVRRTVRKTAYEKMRGTRWAPLFSPVPQPGAAVAAK